MILQGQNGKITMYVDETNLGGLFTEATSAEEEVVLSNKTTTVTTLAAIPLHTSINNQLPDTRARTVFTRMSVIKARHVSTVAD